MYISVHGIRVVFMNKVNSFKFVVYLKYACLMSVYRQRSVSLPSRHCSCAYKCIEKVSTDVNLIIK